MSSQTRYGWAKILAKSLSDATKKVEDYGNDERDFEEILLEPLSISGGEAFSAEDHRGREILELLQNARDAARVVDDGTNQDQSASTVSNENERTGERAVYIGISNKGLLVANTGDTFNFNQSDVRKALQILGESNKGTDTIGEFGVGLTSIRAVGESYEVWTKAPDRSSGLSPEDCWRVLCGPRTITAALAQYNKNTLTGEAAAAYDRFSDSVSTGTEEILFDGDSDTSLPGPPEFPNSEQLPYFTYPVGMKSWYDGVTANGDEEGPLRQRALQLLHDIPPASVNRNVPPELEDLKESVGTFTTAIFVDFIDDEWRAIYEGLFDKIEAPEPESHADRLLNQSFYDEGGSTVITPELLLNLGGLDHVTVEDLRKSSAESEERGIQQWTIWGRQRVRSVSNDHDERLLGRAIETTTAETVRVQGTKLHACLDGSYHETPDEWKFWEFEYDEGRTYDHPDYDWYDTESRDTDPDSDEGNEYEPAHIEVSLLIPIEPDSYRPHLYYPIGDANPDFPFCIHGDFVVKQNRKQLSETELDRNCVVVAETARLVSHVAEVLAQTDEMPAEVPWRLFPSPPADSDLLDNETDSKPFPELLADRDDLDGVSHKAPFTALQAEIYAQLRKSPCIEVRDDRSPTQVIDSDASAVLIDGDPAVMAALAGIAEISDSSMMRTVAESIDAQIPTKQTLETAFSQVIAPDVDDSDELVDYLWTVFKRRERADGHYEASKLQAFVNGPLTTDEPVSHTIEFEQWAQLLREWTRDVDEGDKIEDVPSAIAHLLLDSTIDLGEDADLRRLAPEADSGQESAPYLLPCHRVLDGEVSLEEERKSVDLVSVERHQDSSSAGGLTQQTRRQVMRPKEESEVDVDKLPSECEFNIYVLTKRAQRKHETLLSTIDWGTRQYGGPTDFYRTLLKDAAIGEEQLTKRHVTFLAELYEELDRSQSDELQAIAGSYHPDETIQNLPSQGADASDNLKIRLQARRVKLPKEFLATDINKRQGRILHFNPAIYEAWYSLTDSDEESEKSNTDGEDVPSSSDEGQIPATQRAEQLPDLGETAAVMPTDVDDATHQGIAGQLGIFGVSVLPGVEVITIARDPAHPDRTNEHWNPVKWDSWKEPAAKPDRAANLRETLQVESGRHPYLKLICTPSFGPNVSSDHTDNCSIKNYPRNKDGDSLFQQLAETDVKLASWVWLSPAICSKLSAVDLVPILRYHGTELANTVLETGWSCNHSGGNKRGVDTPIPSLLNWQLRGIDGWESLEGELFNPPDNADRWDRKSWSLRYAVLDTSNTSSRTANLLPSIDGDTEENPIAAEVWRKLGVKPLDDLNATEAALRFNAFINQWAVDSESSTARKLPELGDAHGWQRLYGTLLATIGAELSESNNKQHVTLESLQFLDWLPVVANDDGSAEWYALPVEELKEFNLVYYATEEETWENRIADLEQGSEEFLLRRPGRYITKPVFETVGQHCGANKESAEYTELDIKSATLGDTAPLASEFTPDIKYGLLAAAPDNKELETLEKKYERIVATLRCYDSTEDAEDATWGVIPRDESDGLSLPPKKVKTEAESYWIAYDKTQLETIEDLDIVFQAIFDGGRRDSYRLALLEGEVAGKDTAKRELKVRGRPTLETDLEIAAKILEVNPYDEWLPQEFDETIAEVRTAIKSELGNAVSGDTSDDCLSGSLQESVQAIGDQFRSTEFDHRLDWVTTWLAPETTTKEAAMELGAMDTEISEWQQKLLRSLEREFQRASDTGQFSSLLPSSTARYTERLSIICDAVEEHDEISDIFTHNSQISWSASVNTSVPTDPELRDNEVLPDGCTWFHLAWRIAEEDVHRSEGFIDSLLKQLAKIATPEDNEQFRNTLKRYLAGENVVTENGPSTSSEDNQLLEQTAGDISWEEVNVVADEADHSELKAKPRGESSGGYTGSTTNRPRVAELAVLREVYQALYELDFNRSAIEDGLSELRTDDNYWRTNSGWSDVEALPEGSLPDPEGPLANRLPGEAFDVSDDRGPGYDILDPTGWVLNLADEMGVEYECDMYSTDSWSRTPVPIEVKSVADRDRPAFRFSINQFRRALVFVSEGEETGPRVPYAILTMKIEEDRSEYNCVPASLKICSTPADVYALLPGSIDPADNRAVNELLCKILRGGKLVIS